MTQFYGCMLNGLDKKTESHHDHVRKRVHCMLRVPKESELCLFVTEKDQIIFMYKHGEPEQFSGDFIQIHSNSFNPFVIHWHIKKVNASELFLSTEHIATQVKSLALTLNFNETDVVTQQGKWRQ